MDNTSQVSKINFKKNLGIDIIQVAKYFHKKYMYQQSVFKYRKIIHQDQSLVSYRIFWHSFYTLENICYSIFPDEKPKLIIRIVAPKRFFVTAIFL